MKSRALVLAAALLAVAGCGQPSRSGGASGAGAVDAARLLAADSDADNWLSYGRTYDEQRYSPLDQINDSNVGQLGLAWSRSTPIAGRRRRRSWSTA